jgi:hypothetical protein
VTQSALATQPPIAMALRQSGSGGRHRRNSHAAAWTMPRDHTELHAAAGSTGPRHRKTSQASASRPAPRHRKKGGGNIQAIYPSFHIGQDNSIRFITRRAALPSALAVGLLAVGGVITGAFSTPLAGTERADAPVPGDMASAPLFSPPELTAMSTASPTPPAMADRGVRSPMGASGPAWPIIEQAGTAGVTGNGDTRQTGTTTIVRDNAPEPAVLAPTVTADPPKGHGGGGGPAESSLQAEPPTAGGGALPDIFGSEGPDNRSRFDRRAGDRDTDGRGRADRGFGSPGKTSDGGSASRGSEDHQAGGGGRHRRGGGRN